MQGSEPVFANCMDSCRIDQGCTLCLGTPSWTHSQVVCSEGSLCFLPTSPPPQREPCLSRGSFMSWLKARAANGMEDEARPPLVGWVQGGRGEVPDFHQFDTGFLIHLPYIHFSNSHFGLPARPSSSQCTPSPSRSQIGKTSSSWIWTITAA